MTSVGTRITGVTVLCYITTFSCTERKISNKDYQDLGRKIN